MTRPHLITKLILAATGIRLFVWFSSIAGSAFFRLNSSSSPKSSSITFIIVAAESLLLLTASLILLFRSDGFARIIAGPDADQCEKIDVRWVIAAFRMTACLCGLLIIYPRIERLFHYVPIIMKGSILSYMTLEGQSSQFSAKTLAGVVVEIIKWVIAIYLIFGAPHYVSWQLRKQAVKELNQNSGVSEYEQK